MPAKYLAIRFEGPLIAGEAQEEAEGGRESGGKGPSGEQMMLDQHAAEDRKSVV